MSRENRGKLKLLRRAAAGLAFAGGGLFLMGWPFFRFITYAGKKKSGKKQVLADTPAEKPKKKDSENKNWMKWFSLKHTTINHPRYEHEEEYERGKAWCQAQPVQDWYIYSVDGNHLHASYLPAEDPKRFVVMCHGYRGTWYGSMGHMARFLHENGCSLLMLDMRGCGESEGKYITFGAREKIDVTLWLERLQEESAARLPIYLFGQSMGATTVLLASGHALPPEVKGIIADCGFHSMKQQLMDIASGWFHFKRINLLIFSMEIFCRIFAGFSMRDTNTRIALEKNRRPVLFFHGEEDTYVWPENTKKNYELCRAEKELVLVPGARHLCCSYVDAPLFEEKLLTFFRRYDG